MFPASRKEAALDRNRQEPRAEQFEAGMTIRHVGSGNGVIAVTDPKVPIPNPGFNGGVQWLSICPRSKK